MFAKGSAAKKGLRAFFIVAALLCIVSDASATQIGTLNATFLGTSGQFNWNSNNTGIPGTTGTVVQSIFRTGNADKNFSTFCVDELGGVAGGNDYQFNVHDTISGLPIPGPMGGLKATQIEFLIESFFVLTTPSALNGVGTLSFTGAYAANTVILGGVTAGETAVALDALQQAIWEIVAPNANVGSGDVASLATKLVTYATNLVGTSIVDYRILGLQAVPDNVQDQLFILEEDDFEELIEVPVPAGMYLAGIGMVCLAGVSYLRRRKMVAAI